MSPLFQTKKTQIVGVFVSIFASATPAFAIRGGAPVPTQKYNSVGYLTPACTATLIAPDTVITANHCVVQAGGVEGMEFIYTNTQGQRKRLRAIKTESMSETLSQELALVRLERAATGARISSLWDEPSEKSNQVGLIMGFGATETSPRSLDKRGGNVKVTAYVDIQGGPMIHNDASSPTSIAACVGDSGGPLFLDGKIFGILSFGYSNDPSFNLYDPVRQCKKTEGNYYVPVALYREWIREAYIRLHQ